MGYGICTKCGCRVRLIYLIPERKSDLVIDKHHPPIEGLTPEQFARNYCEGYSKPPLPEEVALE